MAGKDFQSRPPGDDPLLPLDAAPLVPPVAASPPGCEAGPPGASGPPPLLVSPLVPDDGDVLHAASSRTRGRTHRMRRNVLRTGHPSRLGPEFARRGGRARTAPRNQAPRAAAEEQAIQRWSPAPPRQRVRRAAVALGEVRGGLPPCVRRRRGGESRHPSRPDLLQRRARSPGARLPDSCSVLPWPREGRSVMSRDAVHSSVPNLRVSPSRLASTSFSRSTTARCGDREETTKFI